MGFLGQALGFTVERATREVPWDDDAREALAQTGLLPEPHELHFARLRAAFDRGDAILLRTWPAWSVLVGWDRDLDQLAFATVPGFEDLVQQIWGPAKAQLAYLLNPIGPALTVDQSIGAALQFGARVAGGAGPEDGLGYGAALYRATVDRLGEPVFCPSCGEHGDSCAHRTLMRMLGTQRSAVGFLADARDLVGADLPWESAIQAFTQMADLTSTYCGWPDFQTSWGQPDFQADLRRDLETLATLQNRAAESLASLSSGYERVYEG
jgi:hypothetical protein